MDLQFRKQQLQKHDEVNVGGVGWQDEANRQGGAGDQVFSPELYRLFASSDAASVTAL